MGQITLNREDSERILSNPDAEPEARLIAALAIAMFEAKESAPEADGRSLAIARKLNHLIDRELYDATDALVERGDTL